MIRKFIGCILVVLFCCNSVDSKSYYISDYVQESKFSKKLVKYAKLREFKVPESEVKQIAYHIEKYSFYTKLNKYDIAAINIVEAKLNRFAYNKKSNAFGLGGIYNYEKDWEEYLPFLKYHKYEIGPSILATCIAINIKANTLKCKNRINIIRRYNCDKYWYAKRVDKISQELKKI